MAAGASDQGGVRRGVLAAVTAVLVAGAVVVAGLDVSGRLPGGLLTGDGAQASTPSAAGTRAAAPAGVPDPARSPAPVVLAPEPTATGPPPVLPAPSVAALDAVLASPSLGGSPGAVVLDSGSGAVLYDRDSAVARVPASVAKLLTGAGALVTLGPQHRLTTRVVRGAEPGEVVLVGAGDATLDRAGLRSLAGQVSAALSVGTGGRVSVSVDDTLFAGAPVSPDWEPGYVSGGEVSPVSALALNGGLVRPGSTRRAPDPALAAGEAFVRALRRDGLKVVPRVSRAAAPTGAVVLGEVVSPTLAALVEQTLRDSDDDLAEALLRLVAVGAGTSADFAGGSAAVRAALASLGVPTEGLALLDGSGLARGSAVPAATLARLLALAADGSQPELAVLLDGLPVAGFSGTLTDRYGPGAARAAAGRVRAKTGTLTGVSSLAGVASVAGRPVVFVLMADRVPADATLAARDDLDRFAAVLTRTGGADSSGDRD